VPAKVTNMLPCRRLLPFLASLWIHMKTAFQFPYRAINDHAPTDSGRHRNLSLLILSLLMLALPATLNAATIQVQVAPNGDGTNTYDTSVQMGVLIGDTTGDGFVNSADISQTKSQSGNAVTSSNFREDVNVDGFINSADISLVKSKSGTALP